jgi:hypothetical protein
LVEEVFSEEDVGKICEIILCSRSQPDKLVWAGNKIGEFTVRSAYHLVQEEKQMDAGSSSNPQSFSMFWKRIWRLRKINQENQEKKPKDPRDKNEIYQNPRNTITASPQNQSEKPTHKRG